MIGKYIREDIFRRKSKFIFLVISVSIGIAAVIGVLQINFNAQDDLNRQLENFGANMVIYPKSDDFSLQYGGVSLASVGVTGSELEEGDLERIYMIPNAENINIVSPKVIGKVQAGDEPVLLVGVNFTSELRLKKWWSIIGEAPKAGEVLLGEDALERLGLQGQKISLNGRDFTVSGYINRTGTQDDKVIFMELHEVQGILGKQGKLSLIEVMAFCNTCPIDEIIRQIEENVPNTEGVAARQLINSQMSFMSRFLEFGLAVSIFILLMGIISLTTSMMGFVKEKTMEIGILRAIGFRKNDIGRIIIFEALIVAVLAGVFGYMLGEIIAMVLGTFVVGIPVGINLSMFLWAAALSLLVCSFATLIPLRTASRIRVVDALRSL